MRRGHLLAALTLAMVFLALPAAAQQRRAILWLVETDAGSDLEANDAAQLFRELLESADDAEHIVEALGLAEYMMDNGFPLPSCLQGRGPCQDAPTAVAQELLLDVVASVYVHGDGTHMSLTVSGVSGVSGGSAHTMEFHGESLRATAFQVVNDFVGASAHLAITSRPTGASVFINEQPAGETPYQSELPVGIYAIRIELAGYQTYDQTIELRPDQTRLIDEDLMRRYAEITVACLLETATVSVDGQVIGAVNAPLQVEPGFVTLQISAPGYLTEERRIQVDPGTDRTIQVTLRESPEAIEARQMSYIYARPFFFEGALRFFGTHEGFNDAQGTLAGDNFAVVCPRNVEGTCDSEGVPVNSVGLSATLGYSFTNFELELITLSYSVAQIGGTAGDGRTLTLSPTGGGDQIAGRFTDTNRLELRPLALGGRVLFTDTWSAFAHGGVGWYTESLEVEGGVGQTGDFDRDGWNWLVDLGARYHLNDTLYIEAAFGLSDDFSHDDIDLITALTVGLGVSWEDFLGITPPPGEVPPPDQVLPEDGDDGDDDDSHDDDDATPPDELSMLEQEVRP